LLQRLPDVALCDPINTRSKLELGGSLNLCVHPTEVVSNVDEAVGAHTVSQKAAGQSACTNLVPSRGTH